MKYRLKTKVKKYILKMLCQQNLVPKKLINESMNKTEISNFRNNEISTSSEILISALKKLGNLKIGIF